MRQPVALLLTVLLPLALVPPSGASAAEPTVEEGLVAWWEFSEMVEGRVPERTGNGNPAEVLGTSAEDFDPTRGMHIPYRPTPGHALSPDLPYLADETHEMTVTAWVWRDEWPGGVAVSCPARFLLGPRSFRVWTTPESYENIMPDSLPPVRKWIHLAGVVEENRMGFYREGALVTFREIPKPMRAGSDDVHIGWDLGHGVGWQMPGWIWDVRIYDRALSGDEIARLASIRKPPSPVDLPQRGSYLPGRPLEAPAPFSEVQVHPFSSLEQLKLTLTAEDLARLSMAGCGLYERVDPGVWRESGAFVASGQATASAPIVARLVFVGWPEGAQLRGDSAITRACGPPLRLGPEPTDFEVTVPVPEEVSDGLLMLAVHDPREDAKTLLGTEMRLDELACVPAAAAAGPPGAAEAAEGATIRTDDGLTLRLSPDGGVAWLSIRGEDLGGGDLYPLAGWFLTDLEQGETPVPLRARVTADDEGAVLAGRSERLGVDYRIEFQGLERRVEMRAHLRDLTGRDRCLRLEFRLPLTSRQAWGWSEGIRREKALEPDRRYEMRSQTMTPNNQPHASTYPFATLTGDHLGACLAVPLYEQPRLYRLSGYRAAIGGASLACEFDVGLTPETERFPSEADYRLVLYQSSRPWPFRQAVATYYELFPEQFDSHAHRHGNWCVLRSGQFDIPNLGDFHCAADRMVQGPPPADMYGHVANDILGIGNCVYVRPGTWSQEFDGHPSDEDAYEHRMQILAEEAEMPQWQYMFPNPYWGSPWPVLAQATFTSVLHNADGTANWQWPAIRHDDLYFMRCQQYCSYDLPKPNWAGVILRQMRLSSDWGRRAGAPTDGVEFDNIVHKSISHFDYRRDHWRLARLPLVVSTDPLQPAQSKALQLCEFFPRFADEVHRRGGFVNGNFNAVDSFIHAQYFDMIGVEFYHSELIERLRILAGRKPASFLVNPGTDELYERCLAWGVSPGVTNENIWADRPLRSVQSLREMYRQVMPLIVDLSEAGWRPVPWADYTVDDATIERFGSLDSGTLSFTVRQLSREAEDGELTIIAPRAGIGIRDGLVVMNLRRMERLPYRWERDRLVVPLATQQGVTEVVRVCTAEQWRGYCASRVAAALDRAGREWRWILAQHDESLTETLDFEEDAGRWFRYGFEGGEVGLTDDAHGGAHALRVQAPRPMDGRIRTDPFVIRPGVPHRLSFKFQAAGAGRIAAKAVFLPSWFGGWPVGETELPDVSVTAAPADGWQTYELPVETEIAEARKLYLQLDFTGFEGDFAIDSFSLTPLFDPLPVEPRFGFHARRDVIQRALREGRISAATSDVHDMVAELERWREDAAALPDAERQRMSLELDLIEAAVDLAQRDVGAP